MLNMCEMAAAESTVAEFSASFSKFWRKEKEIDSFLSFPKLVIQMGFIWSNKKKTVIPLL